MSTAKLKVSRHICRPKDPSFMNDLDHGDIIIFMNRDDNNNIVKFQKLYSFGADASRCTHVALYMGHGVICHAMPLELSKLSLGGVRLEKLWPKFAYSGKDLCVLRPRGIDEIDRMRAALVAVAFCTENSRYSYESILHCASFAAQSKIGLSSKKNFLHKLLGSIDWAVEKSKIKAVQKTSNLAVVVSDIDEGPAGKKIQEEALSDASSFICSDFILHCYARVLDISSPFFSTGPLRCPVFTPAQIFSNENFESINIKS